MTGLQRIEHAKVHVTDLDRALDFYVDAMGLVEIDRDDGTVYLGCGFDDNFDFAVSEGGTGIEHFAVRATDAAAVDEYENRLDAEGVSVERVDGGGCLATRDGLLALRAASAGVVAHQ